MLIKSNPLSVLTVLGIVMLLTCACQGESERGNKGDAGSPSDADRVIWKTEIGITISAICLSLEKLRVLRTNQSLIHLAQSRIQRHKPQRVGAPKK